MTLPHRDLVSRPPHPRAKDTVFFNIWFMYIKIGPFDHWKDVWSSKPDLKYSPFQLIQTSLNLRLGRGFENLRISSSTDNTNYRVAAFKIVIGQDLRLSYFFVLFKSWQRSNHLYVAIFGCFSIFKSYLKAYNSFFKTNKKWSLIFKEIFYLILELEGPRGQQT